jgi:hypothetical protein
VLPPRQVVEPLKGDYFAATVLHEDYVTADLFAHALLVRVIEPNT